MEDFAPTATEWKRWFHVVKHRRIEKEQYDSFISDFTKVNSFLTYHKISFVSSTELENNSEYSIQDLRNDCKVPFCKQWEFFIYGKEKPYAYDMWTEYCAVSRFMLTNGLSLNPTPLKVIKRSRKKPKPPSPKVIHVTIKPKPPQENTWCDAEDYTINSPEPFLWGDEYFS